LPETNVDEPARLNKCFRVVALSALPVKRVMGGDQIVDWKVRGGGEGNGGRDGFLSKKWEQKYEEFLIHLFGPIF
jgi:hypothetical protein